MPEIDGLSRGELIGLTRRLVVEVQDLTWVNADLSRVNAELVAANAALTDRVARLERLVTRNSKNSGTPPSKDDDLGRTPPADEPAADGGAVPRKRGKRAGASGAQLAWSPDPNETLDHFPRGVCGCGSDLAGAADLGVYARHQQVDIPVVSATVTQHDRHVVRCGCGRTHVAARPEGVPDTTVSYGPSLVSWCVYLMVAHAIPVARCADLVAALTGTRPSDGFVHGLRPGRRSGRREQPDDPYVDHPGACGVLRRGWSAGRRMRRRRA